jgi:hypothetical protein
MTALTLDEPKRCEELLPRHRMELAIQIANTAESLDCLSSAYPIVKEQVKNLHDIAKLLAGSRVLEIYGPAIEEEPA